MTGDRLRPYDYEVDGLRNPPYDQEHDTGPAPCVESQPAQVHRNRRKDIASVVIAAVGASIFLGSMAYSTYKDEKARLAPCKTPTERDIDEVEKLLAAPPAKGTERKPLNYDVTMHSSGNAIRGLWRRPADFGSMLARANTDLRPYHVKISVIRPDEAALTNNDADKVESSSPNESYNDEHVNVPSSNVLSRKATRNNLAYIVGSIMDLPVEYVHYSGLKRVVLYANKGKETPQAYTSTTNHSVYYDVTYEGDPNVMAHEDEHLIDARECGGKEDKDTHFTDLNPVDIYQNHRGYYAFESKQGTLHYYRYLLNRALASGYKKRAGQYSARVHRLATSIVSPTDYSFTNAKEDKAEIGAIWATPQYFGEYLDKRSPVLRNKFIFLLARLYMYKPNIVRYWTAVSARPGEPVTPKK